MIYIITPVWNRADLTTQYFLDHYRLYGEREDVEWVIIDNGSTDSTPTLLGMWERRLGKRLGIMTNYKNEGFGRGCNIGADVAVVDDPDNILVFVNNDIRLNGDYLAIIEDALAEDPDALVGAQLLSHDTGWNKFGNEIIPYIPGWCLAMARKTFYRFARFDERYSLADYEDMDLCYAAQQQGRELIGLDLPITHLSGQSGEQLPDRREITERNRVKFAEKWGLTL